MLIQPLPPAPPPPSPSIPSVRFHKCWQFWTTPYWVALVRWLKLVPLIPHHTPPDGLSIWVSPFTKLFFDHNHLFRESLNLYCLLSELKSIYSYWFDLTSIWLAGVCVRRTTDVQNFVFPKKSIAWTHSRILNKFVFKTIITAHL